MPRLSHRKSTMTITVCIVYGFTPELCLISQAWLTTHSLFKPFRTRLWIRYIMWFTVQPTTHSKTTQYCFIVTMDQMASSCIEVGNLIGYHFPHTAGLKYVNMDLCVLFCYAKYIHICIYAKVFNQEHSGRKTDAYWESAARVSNIGLTLNTRWKYWAHMPRLKRVYSLQKCISFILCVYS